MAKKKFKVQAECITYCYLIVEADNAEEANQIAENTDGGDFIPIENEGDWNVLKTLTEPVKE